MIIPTALLESKSMLYHKIKKYGIPILTVKDVLEILNQNILLYVLLEQMVRQPQQHS